MPSSENQIGLQYRIITSFYTRRDNSGVRIGDYKQLDKLKNNIIQLVHFYLKNHIKELKSTEKTINVIYSLSRS
jgi:hypothetical protein